MSNKMDVIEQVKGFLNVTINARKAHSFRGGMDSAGLYK